MLVRDQAFKICLVQGNTHWLGLCLRPNAICYNLINGKYKMLRATQIWLDVTCRKLHKMYIYKKSIEGLIFILTILFIILNINAHPLNGNKSTSSSGNYIYLYIAIHLYKPITRKMDGMWIRNNTFLCLQILFPPIS